jgi:biopolymer transport protein TolR
MAGGGAPTPAKGGKKSVDFTVNLVPTLDLLSVLVAFLLITAVWTQLARIQASQVLPKTSPTPQEEDPDKEKPKKLMIFVQPEEVTINFTNVDPVAVPPVTFKKVDGDLNKQVREHIKKVSNDTALVVDKKKQAVVIASSDTVEYRQIIETMDILIDNGLPGLSLADANVVKGMLPDDPNAPPPGGAPSPAPPQ